MTRHHWETWFLVDLSDVTTDNFEIVPRFRIDTLAALSRQMAFTPVEVRQAQLAAAELLLHAVDPNKPYPADFVVYRITGYRPKDVSRDMLAGAALQHDLGLLIETVSDTLELAVARIAEPVLSISDVTEKFNVASKTIQRWRRRGLPARRFVFADGKRRVGFLLSSVERFVNAHSDQVARGANFSQVSDGETAEIVHRARKLAMAGCCIDEITRRLGRRMNRSPLTVLHTIKKWDTEHSDVAVLPLTAKTVCEDERSRIVRLFKRGVSIRRLAKKLHRSRATVYRVLLDERINRLTKRKVKFIDDALYHQPDAEHVVEEIARQNATILADSSPTLPADRPPRDLPPYLADLYRTPLLSAAEERGLFLKFNFHKYRFVAARRRLDPQLAHARELKILESHLASATETKNRIVRANLRLVVSVARKHVRTDVPLMELVSDGNITLMRAAESFDIHKGYKFSTYATLALMKGFARSVGVIQSQRRTAGAGDEILITVADSRMPVSNDRVAAKDEVTQLLGRLKHREREVILARYGLNDRGVPATFDEVAVAMGVSAQRVRQIEHNAIVKLRGVTPSPLGRGQE